MIKKQVHSRDVTREMKAKYDKQVSDLKLHYDKILLENDKELYELKNFKKESDYITGKLMSDAEVNHKRALDQKSKNFEKELSRTKKDLQKQHLSAIEQMEKSHNREVEKASNLVDRLRREKKKQAERLDKQIIDIKEEKKK